MILSGFKYSPKSFKLHYGTKSKGQMARNYDKTKN